MLPTCKQVSEQLSEDIDTPIKGLKWLKLKLHLLMCFYCRQYEKQLGLTVKTINLLDSFSKHQPSETVKQRALENYREQQTKK